jgi:two-component system cell cycle response regulator
MDGTPGRVILVDPCDEGRTILAKRLRAQGYLVEAAASAAEGADLALSAPPTAVVADLWMPSVSGVQLCRLLRAEPATVDVPVILRGERDDPRSRFWSRRAGATAFVAKGRMGELVQALARAAAAAQNARSFFMKLSGDTTDVRDRIAQHLDAALFESVLAAEVRALASCDSFERLFDLLSQFASQIISYRWLAMSTQVPERFALHHHPKAGESAEREARAALGVGPALPALRIEDEDASGDPEAEPTVVRAVSFGGAQVGRLALGTGPLTEPDAASLLTLVARELGGPVRMATLVEESQRLATTDPLTGLMNRRAFAAALGEELEAAQRHGRVRQTILLLVDVDHFKAINDGQGHAAGDRVLAALGALLRDHVRPPGVAARWGGEEFVVAVPDDGAEGAGEAGERLRRAIEGLTVAADDGRPIAVTASIGAAVLGPGDAVDRALDRADRAMYAAKVAGRNRVVLSTPEPATAPERSLVA